MGGRWSLSEGDDGDGSDDLIRPFMVTGGRTRGSRANLALTTLIGASPGAHPDLAQTPEAGEVISRAAANPQSVVDLSAALDLPVGVLRVLIGDLANQDLVVIHDAPSQPDIDLVRRLISGVKAL